jgi:hypothetical protein
VRSWSFERPHFEASGCSNNLSSKVVLLVQYLKERFERPTDDKAIVFVQQRYTARLLTNLFSNTNIGTPHLRPGTLVCNSTFLHEQFQADSINTRLVPGLVMQETYRFPFVSKFLL